MSSASPGRSAVTEVQRQPWSATPAAEITVESGLVRKLLQSQHPDLAALTIEPSANGWDNAIFRLGADLAVRLPRRAAAVKLLANEQRFLPLLQSLVPLPVPAPVRVGLPGPLYPWPWSFTPWFEGETADLAPPVPHEALALSAFFDALHQAPPLDLPQNPVRGVELRERATAFARRIASLAGRGEILPSSLTSLWEAAIDKRIDVAPTWIHGDPHARNILVRGGHIAAVVDWGDMGRGDRASDLAAFWMLFDRDARLSAMNASSSVSDATWLRARAWALLYAVVFLDTGLHDDPRMVSMAKLTLERLLED